MRRTALYVVVVSLCAELVETGETVKTNSFELVQSDGLVPVRVQALEDGVDNVVGLLLVFNLILRDRPEVSTRVGQARGGRTLDFF